MPRQSNWTRLSKGFGKPVNPEPATSMGPFTRKSSGSAVRLVQSLKVSTGANIC